MDTADVTCMDGYRELGTRAESESAADDWLFDYVAEAKRKRRVFVLMSAASAVALVAFAVLSFVTDGGASFGRYAATRLTTLAILIPTSVLYARYRARREEQSFFRQNLARDTEAFLRIEEQKARSTRAGLVPPVPARSTLLPVEPVDPFAETCDAKVSGIHRI